MSENTFNSNLELLKNLTEQLNFRDKKVFESERQFRGFFENSAAGMCITDINTGYFIQVNPALKEWLGYTEEELTKNPIVDFLLPDSVEKTIKVFEALKQSKTDNNIGGFINQYRHKKGHGIWLKWHSSIINDKGISYNVCVNITKEIEQGKELMKSKELYRRITENSHDIICLHYPDGRYKYVSPSMFEHTGWEPEKIINKNPYDFFHLEDKEKILKESHQKALDSENGEVKIRYRFRCRNGKYIWLETKTTPFVNELGEVIELKTISRNISSQIELEKSLHTSQEIYKQIVCNSNELLKLYKIENDNPTLVYVSPSCVAYTGYSIEEHLKMPAIHMIHPNDVANLMDKVMQVVKTQTKTTINYRGKHKSEGYKWVESIVTPIITEGKVEYILLSSRVVQEFHDIMKKCQMENSLFKDITKATYQAILVRDKNLNIIWISPNTEVLFGWPKNDILAKYNESNSFVHPEDKSKVSELYMETVKNAVGFTTKARVLNRNIGYRWCKIKVSILLTPNNDVDKVVTFIEDIHNEFLEQKNLETELQMKDQVSHVNQIGVFEISFIGKDRVYTYASKGLYEIYDIDVSVEKRKMRKIINDSLDIKTKNATQSQINDMLQGVRDKFEMTYWITTIAGNRKLLKVKGTAKKTKNQMTALRGTVQDITLAYEAFKNVINEQ